MNDMSVGSPLEMTHRSLQGSDGAGLILGGYGLANLADIGIDLRPDLHVGQPAALALAFPLDDRKMPPFGDAAFFDLSFCHRGCRVTSGGGRVNGW